jgi:hypothetical protein
MNRAFYLILAIFAAFALATTIRVCNDKTCYEVHTDVNRYEWKKDSNGDNFLRVYRPDGTIVDIVGMSLNAEVPKKQKEIRKKHK